MSDRFAEALTYAERAHRTQVRKGTTIPYISHLMAVAAIVLENGGDEDEAIAALLHDAVEDQGGAERLEDIRAHFGDRVAGIVEACSDAITETPEAKPPWRHRKSRYHQHLRGAANASVFLVSAADKLHNARATVSDLNLHGASLWDRFNAGRDDSLWNYAQLLEIYREYARAKNDARVGNVADELAQALEQMAETPDVDKFDHAWPLIDNRAYRHFVDNHGCSAYRDDATKRYACVGCQHEFEMLLERTAYHVPHDVLDAQRRKFEQRPDAARF